MCFSKSAPTPFPILQLPPAFLQQIISKCHWKSYVRLQQTCSVVRDFISRNRHIKIWMDEKRINFKKNSDEYYSPVAFWGICCSRPRFINSASLYGLHLTQLVLPPKYQQWNVTICQKLCQMLQQNHVTCDKLILRSLCYDPLPEETVSALLETVKPREIKVEQCEQETLIAALLTSTTAKSVDVYYLESDEIFSIIQKLTSKFEDVEINTQDIPQIGFHRMWHAIFKKFRYQVKCNHFKYEIVYDPIKLPTRDEMKKEYANLSPTLRFSKTPKRNPPITMSFTIRETYNCELVFDKTKAAFTLQKIV